MKLADWIKCAYIAGWLFIILLLGSCTILGALYKDI